VSFERCKAVKLFEDQGVEWAIRCEGELFHFFSYDGSSLHHAKYKTTGSLKTKHVEWLASPHEPESDREQKGRWKVREAVNA
jgi:hypothetical protein